MSMKKTYDVINNFSQCDLCDRTNVKVIRIGPKINGHGWMIMTCEQCLKDINESWKGEKS